LPLFQGCASGKNLIEEHLPALSYRAPLCVSDIAAVWDGDTHTVSLEIAARILLQCETEKDVLNLKAWNSGEKEILARHQALHLPPGSSVVALRENSPALDSNRGLSAQ